MSITTIENLSNEYFHEIFDYLDGCQIYQSFSNLNHRFHQLLNSSSLRFKIKLDSSFDELYQNISKQLTLINKHQIISFHLRLSSQQTLFFSSFPIDSSYDQLESLVLIKIKLPILNVLLTNLTCLPRLFSLTIDTCWPLYELSDICRLIFDLPKLKYFKYSAKKAKISAALPIATDKQFSSIEYLVINHSCTFKDLFIIISHTPRLSHLNCMDMCNSNSNIENVIPIQLFNLIHISIHMYDRTFDEFRMFMREIECNLEVLRAIIFSEDMDYFDVDRWEEFILEYLPQLERFYFQYYTRCDSEGDSPTYFEDPNPFMSSFWFERKWILEVEMDSFKIIYSIRPYKERWYDINSSTELSQSTQFTLKDIPRNENLRFLMVNIRDILKVAQIYHLEIPKKQIFFSTLIDIIHELPELNSLKIHSLSLSPSRCSSTEQLALRRVSNKNKITNVYLEKMHGIEEVYFLIKLCSRMTYLKIDFINNMDIELFVKDILMKINNDCNQYLRSLCFCLPTADDKMVEKLQEMINREKLIQHYTITRVLNNIYLQ